MNLLTAVATLACTLVALGGQALAQTGARSGEQIVKGQCIKCHDTGVSGAPRIDDRAAWAPRMKRGLNATVRSAMNGHGAMPARGGLADLSDTELRSAILYMFYPAGAALKSGPAPAPAVHDPNRKVIEGMEISVGIMPAESGGAPQPKPSGRGYYYVNVSVHDAATKDTIKDAQVEARAANPVTGGETKKLGLLTVNDAVTYGNYFRMQGKEPYTIAVHVRRAGQSLPVEAKFDFKP